MKKKDFSDAEIEVLLSEVHSKRHILFSSVHSGVSGPKKAWQHITDAVNGVSSVNRTVPEVRRKWFDIKLDSKKRISSLRKNRIQTGEGPPSITRSAQNAVEICTLLR